MFVEKRRKKRRKETRRNETKQKQRKTKERKKTTKKKENSASSATHISAAGSFSFPFADYTAAAPFFKKKFF
jgi:septal ring factor EnvC (AmiA/AmiB activator)